MSGVICSGATPMEGEGGDSFQQGAKPGVQKRVLGLHGNTEIHMSLCVFAN